MKVQVSDIDPRSRRIIILKWLCLVLLILVVFTLQATPSFLEIYGVKPVLLLPLAVSIAMFEGEFAGAFVAMACGLLWDLASESPFGAYGFIFLIAGVAAGLLMRLLLRNEWFNCMFLVLFSAVIILSLEFLFTYAIYRYEDIGDVFLRRHLPMMLYTTVLSPIIYFIVKLIEKIKPEET